MVNQMEEYQHCSVAGERNGQRDEYDFLEGKLLQMTFWAHREALYERIKKKIEKENGEKLDKIADLLIDVSKEDWESDRGSEKKHQELKKKLQEVF